MTNCKLKNPHYKSTAQFYNTTPQTIATTATTMNLGSLVTDTGVAIDVQPNQINLNGSGTYQIDISVLTDLTTAGDVTVAIALNGNILPETVRTITVAPGSKEIETGTVRYINVCCGNQQALTVLITGDGTAAGTAVVASGSVIKLA